MVGVFDGKWGVWGFDGGWGVAAFGEWVGRIWCLMGLGHVGDMGSLKGGAAYGVSDGRWGVWGVGCIGGRWGVWGVIGME